MEDVTEAFDFVIILLGLIFVAIKFTVYLNDYFIFFYLILFYFLNTFMKNSVYFTCLKLTGHGHLKCKAFSNFLH